MGIFSDVINQYTFSIADKKNLELLKLEINKILLNYKEKMDYPSAEYEIMVKLSKDNYNDIKLVMNPINFEGRLFLEEIELLTKMKTS